MLHPLLQLTLLWSQLGSNRRQLMTMYILKRLRPRKMLCEILVGITLVMKDRLWLPKGIPHPMYYMPMPAPRCTQNSFHAADRMKQRRARAYARARK